MVYIPFTLLFLPPPPTVICVYLILYLDEHLLSVKPGANGLVPG